VDEAVEGVADVGEGVGVEVAVGVEGEVTLIEVCPSWAWRSLGCAPAAIIRAA